MPPTSCGLTVLTSKATKSRPASPWKSCSPSRALAPPPGGRADAGRAARIEEVHVEAEVDGPSPQLRVHVREQVGDPAPEQVDAVDELVALLARVLEDARVHDGADGLLDPLERLLEVAGGEPHVAGIDDVQLDGRVEVEERGLVLERGSETRVQIPDPR